MATWEDLSGYIRVNYDIAREDSDTMIQLGFRLADERTHMAIVSLSEAGGDAWAQIEAPIGRVEDVDLEEAAEAIGDALCGGLITHNGMVLVRHAVRLPELDVDEFEVPLNVVVSTADALELRFTGSDDF